MTKKQFEWATTELAEYRITGTYDDKATHAVSAFVVGMFQKFGPRFDKDRFENAVASQIAAGLERKAARKVAS
jgi:hypothetical protein